jgi:DNA helicase-2/ATP-dependent DNA helicase PcrA
MDFDDLLSLTVQLLEENEDLLERYRRQFEFILVDEYQDTNSLQCRFIELLTGPQGNLMVVGDDAQSIYSWRGADVSNILNFAEHWPRARTHKIEINYRSVPEVLNLANAAIAMNRGQVPKTLRPARDVQRHAARPRRARFLLRAGRLRRPAHPRAAGRARLDLNDIAILYRAHFHSMEVQMELTQRGIPFQITSGLRFFEQAHVKDVAAFMKFAVNRQDEVSFMRMVRLIPGIGNASAVKLWTDWLKTDAAKSEAMPASFSEILLPLKVPKKAKETWDQSPTCSMK